MPPPGLRGGPPRRAALVPGRAVRAARISTTRARLALGSAILERADRDGPWCRPETSDPDNVAFHERFAFEVTDPAFAAAPAVLL
jgi:hypothetical protein